MKSLSLLFFLPTLACGQMLGNDDITPWFTKGGALPETILNSRSVVFYSPNLTTAELNIIHENFAQTGIDAVAYFETDRVFGGEDIELAFYNYFTSREIGCLVIVQKRKEEYQLLISPFTSKENVIEKGQPAWSIEDKSLKEILRQVYSTALNSFKKQNLLISDAPETDLTINVIIGRRTEAFASDLKVDKLAVQKFGDPALDAELAEIMKAYPLKYELVSNSISEPDLRKQGFHYILRFVNCRGPVAKQLLGYDVNKAETAIVSITTVDGLVQVKTIPSDVPIYKFYTRQIEFNNVHLGTRWDADTTWQQALKNFIEGMKRELRVN